MAGANNTQGRLLNGIDPGAFCASPSDPGARSYSVGYSGHFIHIEQKPGFREAAAWIGPIADTWPMR